MMPNRDRLTQPLLLASLLSCGIAVLWAILFGWLRLGVVQTRPTTPPVVERIMFQADGTLVIATSTHRNGSARAKSFRTLDGKELSTERPLRWLNGTRMPGPKGLHSRLTRLAWSDRIVPVGNSQQYQTYWYFVHDGKPSGSGYFVGFDVDTKQHVGHIGCKGSRDRVPAKDEWFPVAGHRMSDRGRTYGAISVAGDGSHSHVHFSSTIPSNGIPTDDLPIYIASENKVWEVNLEKRTSNIIFEEEHLSAVGVIQGGAPDPEHAPAHWRTWREQHLVVRARNKLIVFKPGDTKHHVYVIPDEFRDKDFTVYRQSDDTAIVHAEITSEHNEPLAAIAWLHGPGETTRREEIVLSNRTASGDSNWDVAIAMCHFPSPALLTGSALIGLVWYLETGKDVGFATAVSRLGSESWPPLLGLFALSGVLAFLCYRRHCRFALPGGRMWFFFVFLFGVPAAVGYLLHRQWPVQEECTACGRPAPQNRADCAWCGQLFPGPSLRGIEVIV